MAVIAEALEVSRRTVDDDWAVCRLWLSRELVRWGRPAELRLVTPPRGVSL